MKFICGIGFILAFLSLSAQDAVKWKKNFKDLGNDTYEVSMLADLAPGWHLYSTENTNEFIIPTEVKFKNNPNIEWLGPMKTSGKKETIHSEVYEDDLIEYVGDVTYSRKFKFKNNKDTEIGVEILHQVCDATKCLPPENLEYSIAVKPSKSESTNVGGEVYDSKIEETKVVETALTNDETKDQQKDIVDSASVAAGGVGAEGMDISASSNGHTELGKDGIKISSIDINNPLYPDCEGVEGTVSKKKDKGLMSLFALGFLGGLLALLTPCVYPMIPLTISYFTKGSGEHTGKGNAILYALFIFIIFLLISLPFHLFSNLNSDIFNQISTNVTVNILFFVIFVFFAFSFFGYYELTLPQSWLNQSDKLSKTGGALGVFFMALTLVIVSFSCTGPILGGLLGTIDGDNGPSKLTSAFGGFGASWALIFGAFAMFPQLLKSLPKSGGWLNTTKVILGFIELALSLKFLSKADLVSNTFWLKRELFVMLWITIAICTLLYLLGFIRFPHDERPAKVTTSKRLGAVLFFAIGLYLVPGLFPNHNKPNLKLLSGLTPPLNVSYYNDGPSCPLGLQCYHDYNEGMEAARQEGKPVMLDFTGWGCENCRKMEENVWNEPEIYEMLNNEVIIISLYVDEDKALQNPYEIPLSNGAIRKIKTVGNQWSVFEKENFGSQTQPLYVLLTPNEELINEPLGGYNDKEVFEKFLKCGIENYNKNN